MQNYTLWRSRTFWTIVAMVIVGGGNAIVPILPIGIQAIAMVALSALASYFHLDTAKTLGAKT